MSEEKQPAGPCDDPVQEGPRARWLEENRAAMDAWNAYVEEYGVPLGEYRWF